MASAKNSSTGVLTFIAGSLEFSRQFFRQVLLEPARHFFSHGSAVVRIPCKLELLCDWNPSDKWIRHGVNPDFAPNFRFPARQFAKLHVGSFSVRKCALRKQFKHTQLLVDLELVSCQCPFIRPFLDIAQERVANASKSALRLPNMQLE